MDSTLMVFAVLSFVPVTLTFLAANFAAAFWSLNSYAVLPSHSAYLEPIFTHSVTHFSGAPIFMPLWSPPHMVSVMVPVKVSPPAANISAEDASAIAIFFFIGVCLLAYL